MDRIGGEEKTVLEIGKKGSSNETKANKPEQSDKTLFNSKQGDVRRETIPNGPVGIGKYRGEEPRASILAKFWGTKKNPTALWTLNLPKQKNTVWRV